MATTLTEVAEYGSPYSVTVDFTDNDGNAVVPNSVTWTLTNGHSTVINNREDVVISPPTSSVTVVLTDDDLVYSDGPNRILTFNGTYDTNAQDDVVLFERVYFSVTPQNTIIINDEDYKRILTSIGYPIISTSDIGLTDDQIKNNFILPALNTYYHYFPIKGYNQYSVSSNFSIDFPDSDTFGVVDARLNTYPHSGSSKVANTIINELNITIGGKSQRMWGTPNDYGFTQATISEKMQSSAHSQKIKGFKVYVDENERKVKGYTNIYGNMSVTWAKKNRNFNSVSFRFKEDLIRLSQSYLLEFMGLLLEQGTGDLPTELNGSELLDKAETYRENVMEKWRNHTKVVLLR